jgi:hypothetical protein
MKKPELLVLIAIWEFLTALAALCGIGAIAWAAFPWVGFLWGVASAAAIFGIGIVMLFLIAYCGLGIAGGIGLITDREWGRVVSIVHAALSVLNIPIGTVIGILSIIYLVKPEVEEYFASARK